MFCCAIDTNNGGEVIESRQTFRLQIPDAFARQLLRNAGGDPI